MSTKIYNARRLKPGVKLWPFVASVQNRAEKRIKQELTKWYLLMLKQSEDPKLRPAVLKLLKLSDRQITASDFSYWIGQEFRAQSIRALSNPFGMDVSVVFHEHKGRIYFISYANGMMNTTLSFLRNDRSSEDFHYQNQCDKSANCSDAAWEHRNKVWNAMLTPEGHWKNSLVLELLTPNSFFQLDYTVRDALHKKGSKP